MLSERFPPGWPSASNPASPLPSPPLDQSTSILWPLPYQIFLAFWKPHSTHGSFCLPIHPLSPSSTLPRVWVLPSRPTTQGLGRTVPCGIWHLGPLGDGGHCELGSFQGSQIPVILLVVHTLIFITHVSCCPRANIHS